MMRDFAPFSNSRQRPETALPVRFSAIEQAAARIDGLVARTPLIPSNSLSDHVGCPVYLKLETRQPIGAFKIRGAFNALLALNDNEHQRPLIAASTGNHGRSVAYAAKQLGMRATIYMSSLVPANKIEAIRQLGAEIRIIGTSQDDAQSEVERLVAEQGCISIPPFDDVHVVAGQGTIGLELIKDLPELKHILIPLSGGGLAGGIAAAVKYLRPDIHVTAISMERGPAMYASIRAGKPIAVKEEKTLADSLGGGIGLNNHITFPLCRALLDEIILVSEEEIAMGIRHAALEGGEIVEGAGAVGIAAILANKVQLSGTTAVVVSGGNIAPDLHQQIIHGGRS